MQKPLPNTLTSSTTRWLRSSILAQSGGSTVRVYNAGGFEFMALKSDDVSMRFDSLFGEKLVGARHARSPLASSRS